MEEKQTKLKIYKLTVRGKSMTAIDPKGRPRETMMRIFRNQFGEALDSVV